jgi:hypothetical protein
VFAVGGYSETGFTAIILHYDGSSWSTMPGGETALAFGGVWGSSPWDVFAVGWDANGNSVILHYGPKDGER